MKRSEVWSAMILMAVHVVLLPVTINLLSGYTDIGLSHAQSNFAYYFVSAVLTFVLLGGYLRRNFDTLLDNFPKCVKWFVLAWVLYWALNLAMSMLLAALNLNGSNPNDSAMKLMTEDGREYVLAMAVFLAPVVEECIFRGGLFQGIMNGNRARAYFVSIAAFAIYHVWQYALIYKDPSYLIFALQYVPAGYVLCKCCEESGSIWTGIIFHMSVNLNSMLHF